ncbi:MAG: hypothetical protein CMH52_00365 [Myxococcales bacterium]|nr:hypothetical protein [Myxococcales bacterium]
MNESLNSIGYRVIGESPDSKGRFILTCEHASNAVSRHTPTASDQRLLKMHWGYDLGAEKLTQSLCDAFKSVGVLGTESRLIIDVNRHPESSTLIVSHCESIPVSFNENISAEDRDWRMSLYDSFHSGVSQAVAREKNKNPELKLISIHSFTPIWNGAKRPMDVGILFDRDEDKAKELASILEKNGIRSALNAPYSGLTGELMYSANHHGRSNTIPYIEFEIRQDLLENSESHAHVLSALIDALNAF